MFEYLEPSELMRLPLRKGPGPYLFHPRPDGAGPRAPRADARAGPGRDHPREAPPLLVVEVVSPGAENRRRDYLEKRNQYEWRGIGEYWILDPVVGQVTVLSLTSQGYSEATFAAEAVVESPSFPDWALTAEAMLALG